MPYEAVSQRWLCVCVCVCLYWLSVTWVRYKYVARTAREVCVAEMRSKSWRTTLLPEAKLAEEPTTERLSAAMSAATVNQRCDESCVCARTTEHCAGGGAQATVVRLGALLDRGQQSLSRARVSDGTSLGHRPHRSERRDGSRDFRGHARLPQRRARARHEQADAQEVRRGERGGAPLLRGAGGREVLLHPLGLLLDCRGEGDVIPREQRGHDVAHGGVYGCEGTGIRRALPQLEELADLGVSDRGGVELQVQRVQEEVGVQQNEVRVRLARSDHLLVHSLREVAYVGSLQRVRGG